MMGQDQASETSHDPIEVLRRWQNSGAVWQVVERSATQATVALCRCDGGEEVGRLVSGDPALLALLAERTSSED